MHRHSRRTTPKLFKRNWPDLARRHLNKAAIRQKRNYNKRLAGRPFTVGDSVWLEKEREKFQT